MRDQDPPFQTLNIGKTYKQSDINTLFSLNCILSLKLVFVCVFLCCCICYLKKYTTPLKITVFKTLRMAAQFY